MRRHHCFLALTLLEVLLFGGLLLHGRAAAQARTVSELPRLRRLAAALELTDLSLWSEARYTRHPSQADLFTPFQDFPGAPEHFPAGSVVGPEGLARVLAAGPGSR
jgi:hypothetical protein